MRYTISYEKEAVQELEKLETSISQRIIKKVDELVDNPFSKDIKRLKGSDDFRLRVGDYRIIFSIEGNSIIVFKVGHRKHIYER